MINMSAFVFSSGNRPAYYSWTAMADVMMFFLYDDIGHTNMESERI